MRDQRIERRASLRRVEPCDRGADGRIRAEAVNRLGRKRDKPAHRENARGIGHRIRVCGKHPRGQRCAQRFFFFAGLRFAAAGTFSQSSVFSRSMLSLIHI